MSATAVSSRKDAATNFLQLAARGDVLSDLSRPFQNVARTSVTTRSTDSCANRRL
jgi:hypothetical protein